MLFIKLLDGIDKNWSTIEKAKYLYNQIGKIHLMMKDLPMEMMLNLCIKYFIEMLI